MYSKNIKFYFILLFLNTSISGIGQTIGQWDNSNTQTTTSFAIGIGTSNPQAWQDIEYINNTEVGLIISVANKSPFNNLAFSNNLWDNIGLINPNGGNVFQESNLSYIPLNFEFVPVLSNPSKPYNGGGLIGIPAYQGGQALLWIREFESNNPNSYGTRLIVTPDGRTGINMPSPRAALDVRGIQDLNMPVAILGISSGQFTKHIQVVPNLGKGAYNGISQTGDIGMFYTDGANANNDGSNNTGALVIAPWSNNPNPSGIRIDASGNVGIGAPMTNNPSGYKLGVNGLIICKELVVDIEDLVWPDYVFDSTYNLQSLDSLHSYISINKHLPDLRSAQEISQNGEVKISEMQMILLRKIEELTLYIIQLDARNKELEEKINDQ